MAIKSGKPRKQRLFRFTAPMHARQHFVHAHVDKALRAKLKLDKRAVQVAKGDTVKVMSGKNRGKTGKVTRVSLSTGRISIDSLMRKNAKGKERGVQISANNVYITDLNLGDKVRAAKLKLQAAPAKKAEAPRKQEGQPVPIAEKAAGPEKAAAAQATEKA